MLDAISFFDPIESKIEEYPMSERSTDTPQYPNEYRNFVFDQLKRLFTLGGISPTTNSIRASLIILWSCARPSTIKPLDPIINRISEKSWEFESWDQLRTIFDEAND